MSEVKGRMYKSPTVQASASVEFYGNYGIEVHTLIIIHSQAADERIVVLKASKGEDVLEFRLFPEQARVLGRLLIDTADKPEEAEQ